MRKVFVSADSPAELARLEALVRAAPALKLAGSSLGGAGLDAQAAESQADVLLEQATLDIRSLVFAVGVSVISTLIFGLTPALYAPVTTRGIPNCTIVPAHMKQG